MNIASLTSPFIIRRRIEASLSKLLAPSRRRAAERYASQLPIADGREDEIRPHPYDLTMLHRAVIERRPRAVLELGVGFSTLVIADALMKNGGGALYTLDTSEEWLENTRKKLPTGAPVELIHSSASIREINGQLCHMFDTLPDITPDMALVDGPSRDDVQGSINGLSFSGRAEVSADILLYESSLRSNFYMIVDGRSANVAFLRNALKRRYRIRHDAVMKHTTFELLE